MDSHYDEDLSQNSVVATISQSYPELLEKVIAEGWIICAPRTPPASLAKNFEQDEHWIMRHILVPEPIDDGGPKVHFRSLYDKKVHITDDIIAVADDENADQVSCRAKVLFTETFYDDNMKKYKIISISKPLVSGAESDQEERQDNLSTEADYREYLIKNVPGGKAILKNAEEAADEFNFIHSPDPSESALMLPSLIQHVGQLFERSMSASSTANTTDVSAAVETVLLSRLHERVFGIVAMAFGGEDACVNKRAKNLEVEVADSCTSLEDAIGVDERLRPSLEKAGDELSRLPGLKSPMEKMRCFQAAIGQVLGGEDSASLSSDEILPAVIFLILRTRGVLHWTAHVNYASSFMFSSCRSQLSRNESGYILATMEAALEHIKTGVSITPGTWPPEDDNRLLDCARKGEVEGVIKELEKCGENEAAFHHPLCTCQTCSASPTPRTTPLHVASIHGHPLVVDALLSWRRQRVRDGSGSGDIADTEMRDHSMMTSLHHAAIRGHQNILLLLLHAEANINAVTGNGDTPLHLASLHGRESCVKALVYFAEHRKSGPALRLNSHNKRGDTALHSAAALGFSGIVQLLLEYDADRSARNINEQTPFDCAHNGIILNLLKSK